MKTANNNCFAYNFIECSILNKMDCEKCRFFKTKEKFKSDLAKSLEIAKAKGYYKNSNEYLPKN